MEELENEDFEFLTEEPKEEKIVFPDENLPDIDESLHSVFVDFSLENELKGEELEWFKARVFLHKQQQKKKVKKKDLVRKKVKVITEAEPISYSEKPGKLYLKLSETNTIWLFTVNSAISEDNIEDVKKTQRQNEIYEMKKTKKELIRKRCMACTQTPKYMERSQGTITAPIIKKNVEVFASEWDLYDIYTALDENELTEGESNSKFIDLTLTYDKKPTKKVESFLPPIGQDKVFQNSNFKYASLVMERLLASNCYQVPQNVFKKKPITRYDEEPTTFSYNIEPLWYFKKDLNHTLMVTAIDWNPLFEDLLAVGYGDLNFSKESHGFVCIWSPKNPRQPEREFFINDAVTSLHYSKIRPNVLAAGTRAGKVYVLDISSADGYQRILGGENSKFFPEPIWKVHWFQHEHLTVETEKLLAIGESGVLMLFSVSPEQNKEDLLKLNYVISTTKLQSSKRSHVSETLVYDKKTFSGLYFSIFSDKNFCYISTKEGIVIKCNLKNPSMTDYKFLAHDGPVYIVEHSPFTDLVFFTCGADWNVQIWMEEIEKPLVTLRNKAPVRCAKWSPTIPTIIGTISDDELSIWDISRNVLEPMSKKKIGCYGVVLTTLLFSSDGQNIVIGSEDGLVHVVHLSQLPKIPFLQKEALISGLKKSLEKKKELLILFLRITEKNKDNLKTKVLDEINKLSLVE